ncbi:peptidoglycan DD-metalloendopeptidase family protein [Candidatus Ferrigenium straubiae]|jgi:lipoprotein NlpD|uniref:peptidoglycan DD-metalloendopeptidase family protein n=1 Tax=Candidatus Ferrigenium straubiae TaxID=2919506 RepID=UPI003F4AAEB4
MKSKQFYMLLVAASILAGCASSGQRAPVVERGEAPKKSVAKAEEVRKKAPREKDWRPEAYVVQKGDTLYSIAFNHGLDYRELAELNGIQDPSVIQIGQQIRLFRSAAIRPAAPVEIKPIEPPVKEQPRLAKYAYSDKAVAQIEKIQEAKPEAASKPEVKPKPETKPEARPDGDADNGADEALEWSMPAQGKVIGEFSEAANRKGIDIAGKLGQPVTASAPGKVVYAGSGLRGYGKLVIIKHNKTYLSAYAHNDQVLVKEGQTVTRGQKIAEMGNTDADQVKLHFEVRRFGKPVDPAKYLSLGKS